MALGFGQVSDAAARAPQGPNTTVGGLVKTDVPTTGTAFKLTAWKGRLIRLRYTGAVYFIFASSGTPTTLTTTETLDAATPNKTLSGRDDAAGERDLTVPMPGATPPHGGSSENTRDVWLHVYAQTGTIGVRIHPS